MYRVTVVAIWKVFLIAQIAAQENGNFCSFTETVPREIQEVVTRKNYEVAEFQPCDPNPGPDNVLIDEKWIDGLPSCTYNRTITTSEIVTRTVQEQLIVSRCCDGYVGDNCDIVVCETSCQNGGVCAAPNRCNCEGTGYTGDQCQTPSCASGCGEHGSCIAPRVCECISGWRGSSCTIPICENACQNNGTCMGPNQCQCVDGWEGDDCTEANFDCGSTCLNGGTCGPGNVCQCVSGYEGEHCEHAQCSSPCQNGGKCVAPNHCLCPPGYAGNTCSESSDSSGGSEDEPQRLPFLDAATLDSERNEGACISWNMDHYSTFDGKTFYFPGRCFYNLAYECSGLFHIQVNNAHQCEESLCKRSVKIEIGSSHVIALYPNSTATHNGIFVNIPKTVSQTLIVEKIGDYSVVGLSSGVRVFFDNNDSVFVKMPKAYLREMCGLCGNFDGNSSNDFTLNGKAYDNTNEFANKMAVAQIDGATSCLPVPLGLPHPCSRYDSSEIALAENRCNLLLGETFSACHGVVEPTEFISRCVMDICAGGVDNYEATSCNSFTHYSRSCSYHGIVLSWRRLGFCYMECPGGQIHSECTTACPETCENVGYPNECSNNVCVDGCHCPKGTILDTVTNTCVTKEQCPCMKSGRTYNPGDVVTQDCNDCSCVGGHWNCTQRECPRTCEIIGEDHYNTFDGKQFQFAGGCEYVVAQTAEDADSPFAVWVQNPGCGFYDSEPCRKTISIKLYDSEILRLVGGDVAMIGVKRVMMPYFDAEGRFTVRKFSSSFIQVKSKDGFELLWNQDHRIYLKLSPVYKTKVQGLCGLYNLNQADDFTIPSGLTTVDTAEFGNLWKTDVACSGSIQLTQGISMHACSQSAAYTIFAQSICAKLRQGDLNVCNQIVDPAPYISMCQHDVCKALQKSLDVESSKCTVMADYARSCSLASKSIRNLSWRSEAGCSIPCDGGRIFKECVEYSCDMTCRMLNQEDEPCELASSCVEGCVCPEGMVFDDGRNECVDISECSCFHTGVEYPAGSSRQSYCDSCSCTNGKWACHPIPGCSVETLCPAGQQWSECTECQRTCNNMHVSCEQTVCHSGCACPEGKALHDDQCIQPDSCPCQYLGRSYRSGARIKKDCNYCKCQNTSWSCTERLCPAYCSAYGDPHYETFDKKRFEYHGDCTYIMAEDFCGSSIGSFRITVENVPCSTGGVTCTKSVKIMLYDTIIQMIRGVKPIVNKNPFSLPGTPKADFKIVRAGLFILVKTKIGLTVMWDVGTRVYVKLEPKFMGEVCGLCGNYDGDALNDFFTRQGELESRTNIFGDSWRVFSGCPRSEEEPIHPCTVSPNRAEWAQFSCRVLRQEPFSVCHAYVDPEPYYESCVWDSCGCDRGGDCECLCTAVSAYARDCNERGISVRWRSTGNCGLQCENGMVYQECGTTCTSDCWTGDEDDGCTQTCVEGCHCPNGSVFHNGTCVERQKCPCKVGNVEIPTGYVMEYNCMDCTCEAGQMVCVNRECRRTETTENPSEETTHPVIITTSTGEPVYTTTAVLPVTSSVRETTAEVVSTTPEILIETTTTAFTTPSCPERMEFSDCVSSCPLKCHYNTAEDDCSSPVMMMCQQGCVCPGNKALDENGNCVEQADCACRDDDGNRIIPGEKWQRGACETCICYNNEAICASVMCAALACDGSRGFRAVTLAGDCCPTCVRTLTTTSPVESTPSSIVSTEATTTTVCNEDLGEVYASCNCIVRCGQVSNTSCEVQTSDEYEKCCTCPEGMARDSTNSCVRIEDCPCIDEVSEAILPGGSSVDREPCSKCTCINGEMKCSSYCSIDSCKDPNMIIMYDDEGCCYCTVPSTTTVSQTFSTSPSSITNTFASRTTEIPITNIQSTTPHLVCMCGPQYFTCANCEKCIHKDIRCDGMNHCSDGSDELNCPCLYNDTVIENEESWMKSECITCTCEEKNVICTKTCNLECELGFLLQYYNDDRCCSCEPSVTTVQMETSSFEEVSTTSASFTTNVPSATTAVMTTSEVTTTRRSEVTTKGICSSGLGFESGAIADNQISASSYKPNSQPNLARLQTSNTEDASKSWSPAADDLEKYLEVDFKESKEITSISTQGGQNGQFVSKYSLMYENENGWHTVKNQILDDSGDIISERMIFPANSDDISIVKSVLPNPVIARQLRIIVVEPESDISLRIEVHGCRATAEKSTTKAYLVTTITKQTVETSKPVIPEETTPAGQTTTPAEIIATTFHEIQTTSPVTEIFPVTTTEGLLEGSTVTTEAPIETTETVTRVTEEIRTTSAWETSKPEECHASMGLAAESPIRSGITFSASSAADGSDASFARLNNADESGNPISWKPAVNGEQYLQISFQEEVIVTAIEMQGDGIDSWVKKFNLAFLNDVSDSLQAVADEDGPIVFDGNSDANSITEVELPFSIAITALRIIPKTWVKNRAIRVDVIGCSPEKVATTTRKITTGTEILTTTPSGEIATTTKRVLPTTVKILTSSTLITEQPETEEPVVTEETFTTTSASTSESSKPLTTQEVTVTSMPVSLTSTPESHFETTTVKSTFTTEKQFEVTTQEICSEDMGMERYLVAENGITASSEVSGNEAFKAAFIRIVDNQGEEVLDGVSGSWIPMETDENPFLEMRFSETVRITSVITENFVSDVTILKYSIQYIPVEGDEFVPITEFTESEDSSELVSLTKEFVVSSESGEIKMNDLEEPVTTKAIRIYPKGSVNIKVEYRGCVPEETTTIPVFVETTKSITSKATMPVTSPEGEPTASSFTTTSAALEETATVKPVKTSTMLLEVTSTEVRTETPHFTERKTSTSPNEYTSTMETPTTTKRIVTTTTEYTSTVEQETGSSNPTEATTTEIPFSVETIQQETTNTNLPQQYCDDTMGLEVGTTSELFPTFHASSNVEMASSARLGSPNAWYPINEDSVFDVATNAWVIRPWVQVSYQNPVTISGIQTQGDENEDAYVTIFTLSYSKNYGQTWSTVTNKNNQPILFQGNTDSVTIQETELPERVDDITDIRVKPIEWHVQPSLRIELKGCYTLKVVTTTTTKTKEVVITTEKPTTESLVSETQQTTGESILSTTVKHFPTTSKIVKNSSPVYTASSRIPSESSYPIQSSTTKVIKTTPVPGSSIAVVTTSMPSSLGYSTTEIMRTEQHETERPKETTTIPSHSVPTSKSVEETATLTTPTISHEKTTVEKIKFTTKKNL